MVAGAGPIAAVVPALDEAARIGATLDALHHAGIDEIVVVDGGSSDDTVQRAQREPQVKGQAHAVTGIVVGIIALGLWALLVWSWSSF